MAVDAVSAARLGVFLAFAPFALFCLIKHGKSNILGWWYVVVFCGLRIATGGMGLHGNQQGETYLILNSIGLSPLMLAVSGILYESRKATNPRLRRLVDSLLEFQFHAVVIVGMIMIIIAIVHFEKNEDISESKKLLDVGSAISSIAWGLLVLWALVSLHKARNMSREADPSIARQGRVLLYACFITLPLIALRIVWGVTFLELEIHKPDSSFISSLAITVCLNVVPEMVIVAILLVAGVYTHRLNGDMTSGARMSRKYGR